MPAVSINCPECKAPSSHRLRDLDADRPMVICPSCSAIVVLPSAYRPIIQEINLRADRRVRSAVDALPAWLRRQRFFE